jgi:phosphoribosyl-ATP pyrophosphohydrolase
MDGRILDQLFETIQSRRSAGTGDSWTAQLFAGAPDLPAKKLIEEANEAAAETIKGDRAALTKEAADVIYHLLVVLAATNVSPQEVWAELDHRSGMSGLDEKANR